MTSVQAWVQLEQWIPGYNVSRVSWGLYDVENLTEIAVKGRCRFALSTANYERADRAYLSEVMLSPTWVQLFVVAENALQFVGEQTDHIVFEGISLSDADKDGVPIFEFSMGS